jgi:hypothetical protein
MRYLWLVQVSVPKKVSGWRDKLSRSDSLKKEEQNSPAYHGKKRSSITKARANINLNYLYVVRCVCWCRA